MSSALEEARRIVEAVAESIPQQIDGKSAIEEMRAGGSRHWRQMEWIGWWLEHFAETTVVQDLGATRGPTYGRTEFDLACDHVWDLKAHPDGLNSLILNDREAVDDCLSERGGVGFIIVHGAVDYDETGAFKAWHDALKGGTSAYERARVARNAPSRRRKVRFRPSRVEAIWFDSADALHRAVSQGWMGFFQEDMRNSNGNPRRAKYMLKTGRMPSSAIVAAASV